MVGLMNEMTKKMSSWFGTASEQEISEHSIREQNNTASLSNVDEVEKWVLSGWFVLVFK